LLFSGVRCSLTLLLVAVEGKADVADARTLQDLMKHLSACVISKKSKNIEVLHIAAEVSHTCRPDSHQWCRHRVDWG